MVDMMDVLKAIDAYQATAERSVTDAELSRRATGSSDTIRNWRRAVRDGKDAGAHVKKLLAVGRVIGVDFAFDDARPLIRTDEEIRSTLERVVGLTENDVEFIMRQIKGAQISNGVEQLQTPPHDQHQSASRHHESAPSDKRPRQPAS